VKRRPATWYVSVPGYWFDNGELVSYCHASNDAVSHMSFRKKRKMLGYMSRFHCLTFEAERWDGGRHKNANGRQYQWVKRYIYKLNGGDDKCGT